MNPPILKIQTRTEIHYPIKCGKCGDRCGWSPTREHSSIPATCFDCAAKERKLNGRKTRKQFMAAQLEMPIKIQGKLL